MTPILTADQRDALYDQILERLSGIGDIGMAIEAAKFDDADRLGREFSDDLRLLLTDLGIGEGSGEPVELTTPPDVLRRLLPRMRERAEAFTASHEGVWEEERELRNRSRLVAEACESVLGTIGHPTEERQQPGDQDPRWH